MCGCMKCGAVDSSFTLSSTSARTRPQGHKRREQRRTEKNTRTYDVQKTRTQATHKHENALLNTRPNITTSKSTSTIVNHNKNNAQQQAQARRKRATKTFHQNQTRTTTSHKQDANEHVRLKDGTRHDRRENTGSHGMGWLGGTVRYVRCVLCGIYVVAMVLYGMIRYTSKIAERKKTLVVSYSPDTRDPMAQIKDELRLSRAT